MQNHVKLEVSLEVINNEIATNMKKLNIAHNYNEIQKLKKQLKNFLKLKEQAYMGDRNAIEKILNLRKEDN